MAGRLKTYRSKKGRYVVKDGKRRYLRKGTKAPKKKSRKK